MAMVAKFGQRVKRSEGFANLLVAQNTIIPVPNVLDIVDLPGGGTFILMSQIRGTSFGQIVTLRDMTPPEIVQFEDDLRGWLMQLRAIAPPPGSTAISGFMGSKCRSYRYSHNEEFGPFADQDEFHRALYNRIPPQEHDNLRSLIEIREAHSKRHRICFTHGDMSPSNLLVDERNRLCGLVDFECAGWYPEYWEYTYACYLRYRYAEWMGVWSCIFPQYGVELEAEKAMWKVSWPW
jgi:aminoglycoside phosphotransferase (APT) family kinase protein